MFFGLSKIIWAIIQPLTFICLLGLAGLIARFRWPRAGQGMMTVALCGLLFIAALPIGPALSAWWEYRYPPPRAVPSDADGIIVLGGALESYLSDKTGKIAANGQIERIFCFVELARANPGAKLVFSGGSGDILNPDAREADDARALFALMGLADRDILYEDQSRNTYENVINTKQLLKPAPHEKWIVTTSALHMPRTMGIFTKAGWQAMPYPCDYNTDGTAGLLTGLPSAAGNVGAFHAVFREFIGIMTYYLTGKSAFILPPRQVASDS